MKIVERNMLHFYRQDYFGYDVFFVMNITDIDDKIIKRYPKALSTDNLNFA